MFDGLRSDICVNVELDACTALLALNGSYSNLGEAKVYERVLIEPSVACGHSR